MNLRKKESSHVEVYMPINAYTKGEQLFFKNLYRFLVYKKIKAQKGEDIETFGRKTQYLELLDALNNSYMNIYDVSEAKTNAYGEYNYPPVLFMGDCEYICADIRTQIMPISISDLFSVVALFYKGQLGVGKLPDGHEEVVAVLSLKEAMFNYLENTDKLASYCTVSACKKIVDWLENFPVQSRCKLYMNSLFTVKDVQEQFVDIGKIFEKEEAIG